MFQELSQSAAKWLGFSSALSSFSWSELGWRTSDSCVRVHVFVDTSQFDFYLRIFLFKPTARPQIFCFSLQCVCVCTCACNCVCVPVGRCRHICILVEIKRSVSIVLVICSPSQFLFIFNCVYVWGLMCACGYVHTNVVPEETRRGHWILQSWSYRQF